MVGVTETLGETNSHLLLKLHAYSLGPELPEAPRLLPCSGYCDLLVWYIDQ